MVNGRAERLRKKELTFQRFSSFLDMARNNSTNPPPEFSDQISKLGKGNPIRALKEFINPCLKKLEKGMTKEEIWSDLSHEIKELFKPE